MCRTPALMAGAWGWSDAPGSAGVLPVEMFKLYAVSARSPENLRKNVILEGKGPGVYGPAWGTHRVCILALDETTRWSTLTN